MEKIYPSAQEHARFKTESENFSLAWKCDDCVHFLKNTGKCGLEYPNHELITAESFDTPRATYVFCKHFELI